MISIRSKRGETIAINNLSDKALRIYLMLTSNADGFETTMSSNGIAGQPLPLGMSRSSYTRAIAELKENGFLVKRKDSSWWDFYDIPKEDEKLMIQIHKKEQDDELERILECFKNDSL